MGRWLSSGRNTSSRAVAGGAPAVRPLPQEGGGWCGCFGLHPCGCSGAWSGARNLCVHLRPWDVKTGHTPRGEHPESKQLAQGLASHRNAPGQVRGRAAARHMAAQGMWSARLTLGRDLSHVKGRALPATCLLSAQRCPNGTRSPGSGLRLGPQPVYSSRETSR